MSTILEALTFRQAAARYPAFTESAFRWLRFNGIETGFDTCVIKVGRRVLLDTEAFERWLASHKVSGAVSSTSEAAEKLGPQFGSARREQARDDVKQKARAKLSSTPEAKSARRTSSGRKPARNEIKRTT